VIVIKNSKIPPFRILLTRPISCPYFDSCIGQFSSLSLLFNSACLYCFLFIHILRMDAHARSLLERLNTTSSPKPLKSPTSETKRIATPVSMDNIPTAGSGHKTPISAQNQRPTHATLEEPEATMSVKDLLVSARHRSRETSLAPSSHSTEDTHPTETNSTDTVIQDSSSRLHPLSAKGVSNIVLHTSDGDSSAKEELPTTPGGSNNSSTVSSSAEKSCDLSVDVHLNPPQGHRVINNVPSIVTLSPMKPNVPRLQITTDSAGRSLPGDGIEQIANLARTFSLHDRDIIGATTKYIVYALKGMDSSGYINCRWTNSYYRSEYWNQSYCRDTIIRFCDQSHCSRWIRFRRVITSCP
jgi:hypothetical protein